MAMAVSLNDQLAFLTVNFVVWPHFYFPLNILDSTALPSLDMAMAMMVEMGDGGGDRLIDTNTFTFQHNTIYNI